MVNDIERESKAKKLYESCPLVHDSLAMKNFSINQKYSKQYSCDFMNKHFDEKTYVVQMEYTVMHEFMKFLKRSNLFHMSSSSSSLLVVVITLISDEVDVEVGVVLEELLVV